MGVGSFGITLLQGVILDVQHGAYGESLVKLKAKFIPKHKGHCPTLVGNFEVRLECNEGRGEKQIRQKPTKHAAVRSSTLLQILGKCKLTRYG